METQFCDHKKSKKNIGIPIFMRALFSASLTLYSSNVFALTSSELPVPLNTSLDFLWILISAVLVFIMQAGFLAFEVGCVRPKSIISVAIKNVIDWTMVTLVFFLFGFGFMFGSSSTGFIGTDLFLLQSITDVHPLGMVFFLFQLAFAATAATIVSGAMSERTALIPYLWGSFFIGLIIYPVFGHWVWGTALLDSNKPFLAELGFIDFAGSTVVHGVGGWAALVGVAFIGPRMGRYDADGNPRSMKSFSIAWSALGLFILWFGWWGFNGGSTGSFNTEVGEILVNTNISAASAGIAALAHCWFVQKKDAVYEKFMGGILGGLVAITASCNMVSPISALIIGACAGVIHNIGFSMNVYKLKLDDPVGAIPVHLYCGIWGSLCVALFGRQEMLVHSRIEQIGIQLLGILACALWTVGTSLVMFKILKTVIGLRVSPQEEKDGIQIERRLNVRQTGEKISEDELKKLMGL